MIENIKARFGSKKFNISTEKEDKNRKTDSLIGSYYVYNGTIYFGSPFFIFFKSNKTSWYTTKQNKLNIVKLIKDILKGK